MRTLYESRFLAHNAQFIAFLNGCGDFDESVGIVGFDLGRTHSNAAVRIPPNGPVFPAGWGTAYDPNLKNVLHGEFLYRLSRWVRDVLFSIDKQEVIPIIVGVEGYAYDAKFYAHQMGELGGIVRCGIRQWAVRRKTPVFGVVVDSSVAKMVLLGQLKRDKKTKKFINGDKRKSVV